jgi:hypothetical protein
MAADAEYQVRTPTNYLLWIGVLGGGAVLAAVAT